MPKAKLSKRTRQLPVFNEALAQLLDAAELFFENGDEAACRITLLTTLNIWLADVAEDEQLDLSPSDRLTRLAGCRRLNRVRVRPEDIAASIGDIYRTPVEYLGALIRSVRTFYDER